VSFGASVHDWGLRRPQWGLVLGGLLQTLCRIDGSREAAERGGKRTKSQKAAVRERIFETSSPVESLSEPQHRGPGTNSEGTGKRENKNVIPRSKKVGDQACLPWKITSRQSSVGIRRARSGEGKEAARVRAFLIIVGGLALITSLGGGSEPRGGKGKTSATRRAEGERCGRNSIGLAPENEISSIDFCRRFQQKGTSGLWGGCLDQQKKAFMLCQKQRLKL